MKKWLPAAAALAVCIVLDILAAGREHRHGWHAWPAVYTLIGLAGSLLLIAVSKILGRLLHRPQNYYRE